MPRYARIDGTAGPAWPRRVTGWYDTGEIDYPGLDLDGLVAVPDDAWGRRLEHAQSVAEDGAFVDTPPDPSAPPPVPAQVTVRQLLIGLAREGVITRQEARDAASTGAVPPFVQAAFATLDDDAAFEAEITWRAMTAALRGDPLVALLGAVMGKTSAELDDAFRAWVLI